MRLVVGYFLLVVLLVTNGCLPSEQAPAKADLHATDTPAKVPALVQAAEDRDASVLPELVQALSDKDPAVRLFAIQSLEARTGQTLGFRYYDAPEKRQAAMDRWHAWLKDPAGPRLALPNNENPTD